SPCANSPLLPIPRLPFRSGCLPWGFSFGCTTIGPFPIRANVRCLETDVDGRTPAILDRQGRPSVSRHDVGLLPGCSPRHVTPNAFREWRYHYSPTSAAVSSKLIRPRKDTTVIVKQVWTGNNYRNFNYLIACAETGEALAVDPLDHEKCANAAKA